MNLPEVAPLSEKNSKTWRLDFNLIMVLKVNAIFCPVVISSTELVCPFHKYSYSCFICEVTCKCFPEQTTFYQVHRLDRDSSGILVMGRTQTSTTVLHSIFREKTFAASNDVSDCLLCIFSLHLLFLRHVGYSWFSYYYRQTIIVFYFKGYWWQKENLAKKSIGHLSLALQDVKRG